METAPSNNEASSGTSALDDGLWVVLDHGITVEEHLLYLASRESHTHLRNACLPRCAGMKQVRILLKRGYLEDRYCIPMDAHGSTSEFRLSHLGIGRLLDLRSARKAKTPNG